MEVKELNRTFFPTLFKSSQGESLTIYDLAKAMVEAGETLTFDERYLEPHNREDWQETCFKEIKLSPKLPAYISKKQTPLDLSFDDTIKELKNALKKHFVDYWDSKRKKVFLHSAGFDSRILSGILVELREEKGEDWIGELHFRCHQPEGEMFIKIMQAQGWAKDQYSLWEDFKGPDNHYNLGRIEPVNGFMSHIQQYDFFSDIVDKETILIGGIYGGEMFDYPARGKKHFTNFDYCNNEYLNSLRNYMLHDGETVSKYMNDCYYMICPYLSYDYLKIATRVKPEYITRKEDVPREHPDNIREALTKSFDFDIFDVPYVRHDYHWNTTDKRWNEMKLFYYSSLFYEKYQIEISLPFHAKDHDSKLWAFSVMYQYIYA